MEKQPKMVEELVEEQSEPVQVSDIFANSFQRDLTIDCFSIYWFTPRVQLLPFGTNLASTASWPLIILDQRFSSIAMIP